MSLDNVSEDSNAGESSLTNGQKKPSELDTISPESSGRHSRNSRRSRERSPKHKSKADRGSSKKKRKERSVTPKKARSRSRSEDRHRSRHRDRSRDKSSKRRDERGKKSKSSRKDRSRDRSSTRRHGKRGRRRRSASSSSSEHDIRDMEHSSTLGGLLGKKGSKKSKSKRKRKGSTSSSSSSEDQRENNHKPSNGAGKDSVQQANSSSVSLAGSQPYSVQAVPPPGTNPFMLSQFPSAFPGAAGFSGLMPPPVPPAITPAGIAFAPPPLPPPTLQQVINTANIPVPPLPPPPLPPPTQAAPSTSAFVPPAPPKPPLLNKYNRPVVLNRTPRDDAHAADWGHGSDKKYHLIEQVGEGTYGQVYKANDMTGNPVALKKVRLDNEREGFPITAVREIKILRQLNHTNVVMLKDIVTDQTSSTELRTNNANFYLVFEYVDHDLTGLLEAAHNKLIPEFTSPQIAVMFKQLLAGLEYCHSKKFLHRDIKCSNILVNNRGELKIADWGLARLYHDDVERPYTNRVITLWYRPPELLLGCEHYGPAVDVWSVGCILAEFFTKKAIFMGQHEAEQLALISGVCGTPTPEVWPDVVNMPHYRSMRPKKTEYRKLKDEYSSLMPKEAIDLLDKMLMLDPKKRISASEALRHHWIRHIDSTKVQPLQLPMGQDCHELWSKKQKKDRRSGIAPTVQLATMSVPVNQQTGIHPRHTSPPIPPTFHHMAQRVPDMAPQEYQRMPMKDVGQAFVALFQSHSMNPHPANYEKAKSIIMTYNEPTCIAICEQIVQATKGRDPGGHYNSAQERLLMLAAEYFGMPKVASLQHNPLLLPPSLAYPAPPPPLPPSYQAPPPQHQQPPPHRMYR